MQLELGHLLSVIWITDEKSGAPTSDPLIGADIGDHNLRVGCLVILSGYSLELMTSQWPRGNS